MKMKMLEPTNASIVKAMETAIKEAPRGYLCECWLDQNRYIGDDPVGHICFNKATKKVTTEFGTVYFCDSCVDLLGKEPERLTFFFKSEEEEDDS